MDFYGYPHSGCSIDHFKEYPSKRIAELLRVHMKVIFVFVAVGLAKNIQVRQILLNSVHVLNCLIPCYDLFIGLGMLRFFHFHRIAANPNQDTAVLFEEFQISLDVCRKQFR
jgi:hypothetical protein